VVSLTFLTFLTFLTIRKKVLSAKSAASFATHATPPGCAEQKFGSACEKGVQGEKSGVGTPAD
jgi:hypothetical protein